MSQKFDVIKVVNELEARLEDINEPIDVAVICDRWFSPAFQFPPPIKLTATI
jgi:hypothetical protein